jgi:hypothetical protein
MKESYVICYSGNIKVVWGGCVEGEATGAARMQVKLLQAFVWCLLVHLLLEAVVHFYFVSYIDCAYNIQLGLK